MAPSWTLPGSNAAQPTSIEANPTSDAGSSTATDATKSLKGHEKSSSSEGAASVNVAGSWLALVGLGLGIVI